MRIRGDGRGDHRHPWARERRAEYLGGLTIVDVADEAEAHIWAGRIAEACGWPQELRQFHGFTSA